MRLILPILVFILTAPIALRAQLDPVTLALRAYQGKDYEKAKELIDIAAVDETFNTRTKTWVFRGYIYKDMYKLDRLSSEGRSHRNESINAFKKTLELDTEKEFNDDCIKNLHYLESTLYNDGAKALEGGEFKSAEAFYDEYQELARFINPQINLAGRDIEFKLFYASKLSLLLDKGQLPNPDSINNKVSDLYKDVISLDSNNVNANYNLAIHYYNQGVNIIDNMDYELPFEDLFLIQEKVMLLFSDALPYMLKAYQLKPERTATLQGLSGIYFGLNDIEKSEFYQKKLEEIEGK